MTQRYFEDFAVGDRFKSPSRTLTDAHFLFFAGMTGDNHPIHYDDEYGKKTRYGRRVAHGLLLTSLTAVGASTLAPVIEESIGNDRAYLGEAISRAQRAIKSGDLAALAEILAASADAQAVEAAEYISSLD